MDNLKVILKHAYAISLTCSVTLMYIFIILKYRVVMYYFGGGGTVLAIITCLLLSMHTYEVTRWVLKKDLKLKKGKKGGYFIE